MKKTKLLYNDFLIKMFEILFDVLVSNLLLLNMYTILVFKNIFYHLSQFLLCKYKLLSKISKKNNIFLEYLFYEYNFNIKLMVGILEH